MKILVFSDSHSYTDYMVECTRRIHPDAVIHLGDYYADADVFCREFPDIALYAVPGNCDRYRGGYQPDPVAVVELDEIGFLEAKSEAFCQAVLQLLNRNKPVIAAVKNKEHPFLNTIREHPNVHCFYITPKNRDALYEEVLEFMKLQLEEML